MFEMKRRNKNKGRSHYPWGDMEHKYVTSPEGEGEVTYEKLCAEYGCKISRLAEVAAKNRWTEKRKESRKNVVKRAVTKTEETAAQRRHRHAQLAKLIQAKGVKALQDDEIVPDPGKILDAAKFERALYGEAGEVAQVEITDRDKRMAAAYWKANLDLMEKDSDGD